MKFSEIVKKSNKFLEQQRQYLTYRKNCSLQAKQKVHVKISVTQKTKALA